jgi:FixJ family two-component response regulator
VLRCSIAEERRVPQNPVIAIVDDDESFRHATLSFVRSLGYSAAAFSSADAFLNSNAVCNTDCLITDLQMPGMSGIQLQNHLLAQGKRVPVIFVSAFPETEARDHALRAGAIGFLGKPFADENLISCLNKALATRTR